MKVDSVLSFLSVRRKTEKTIRIKDFNFFTDLNKHRHAWRTRVIFLAEEVKMGLFVYLMFPFL